MMVCLGEWGKGSAFCMMLHSGTQSSPALKVHEVSRCLCPAFPPILSYWIPASESNTEKSTLPRRLFKGVSFPEGFLREHCSPEREGKLRSQKPKRALKEVMSLLFCRCSGQLLFWLQFYLGVPMAAETTQASFLWFSASQGLFERNHCPGVTADCYFLRSAECPSNCPRITSKSGVEWKL